ncbi:MAG: hypothetical protein AMXMBFR83_09080 [Phycisphaerae bacterium]
MKTVWFVHVPPRDAGQRDHGGPQGVRLTTGRQPGKHPGVEAVARGCVTESAGPEFRRDRPLCRSQNGFWSDTARAGAGRYMSDPPPNVSRTRWHAGTSFRPRPLRSG